jgi:hypothetical protein
MKGHARIDHRHLQPLRQGTCRGPESHPMDATIAPEEERAPPRRDGGRGAEREEVRP